MKHTRRILGTVLAGSCLLGSAGCLQEKFTWRQLNPFEPAVVDPGTDTYVLRPDGLVPEKAAAGVNDRVATVLAAGRDAFRREQYDTAESYFARIADNDKNPAPAVQEALYYQAESLRLTGRYPRAADLYSALLSKFPNTSYREQCVQHMFDIANYWLDETRVEMREDKERREGKRWFVLPRFVSTEKSKPFLDREGRAIDILEKVRMNDISGPLADEALFMCGVVKMYHEDYREADHYFSQIHIRHPDSKRAAQGLKLAVFCKHMATGGSDYDGRKAAEARKLIQTAFAGYPELAHDPKTKEWLERQRVSIDMQQAEKDYKLAEFYRRTDHPGSAYFIYDLVQKRYPDTKFARLAKERWESLRAEIERKEGTVGQPAQPPQKPAASVSAPVPAPAVQPGRPVPAKPAEPKELPPTLPQPTEVPPNPATLPTPTPGGPQG